MSDFIGHIPVPDLSVSATAWPLTIAWGFIATIAPRVHVHQMESVSADVKIEQRFLAGSGARRFRITSRKLTRSEMSAFAAFYEGLTGPFQAFTFPLPSADGLASTNITACFAADLPIGALVNGYTLSCELVEVVTANPSYAISATVTRFPNNALQSALAAQEQIWIPLLKIQTRGDSVALWGAPKLSAGAALGATSIALSGLGSGTVPAGATFRLAGSVYATSASVVIAGGAATLNLASGLVVAAAAGMTISPIGPAIYVSDRRCQIGGIQYLPRLLDWGPIVQSLNGESDDTRFVLGNADRVMTRLANDVNLGSADLQFSLYSVATGIKLDLWAGIVPPGGFAAGGDSDYTLNGQDELAQLTLQCPDRDISRTCWKDFDDGAGCPFASIGTLNTGSFPLASGVSCDKSFDGPNGCQAHGMEPSFGGVYVQPQEVRTKDNSTGFAGFGRTALVSDSVIADSVYSESVPHVYTDTDLSVNGKIIAGRDEGDFYDALALVCEGPIGSYGAGYVGTQNRINPLSTTGAPLITFLLDGELWHGYPGPLGLRLSLGNDPNPDPFSLGQGTPQTYAAFRAAGTAFVELRRQDASGLQLSTLAEHSMQVVISQGLSGLIWTAPGTAASAVLTNPIWITVNEYFRCTGRRYLPLAQLESLIDLPSILGDGSTTGAGTICNLIVPALVGGGTETQFKFVGSLIDRKPLRDWMRELLNNCLGYMSRNFGKLRFGIRVNASALTDFNTGNIILNSLQFSGLTTQFNRLTLNFANKDFGYLNDSVVIYDIDHAKLLGNGVPRYIKGETNLAGCYTKSQAIRIAATRLKEETGGATVAEQAKAKNVFLRSTILGLDTEPGAVFSVTHADAPEGHAKFRTQQIAIHSDYSMDVIGRWVTDSMYDLDQGPKPVDVASPALPTLSDFHPTDWGYSVDVDDDQNVVISGLYCKTYGSIVNQGIWDIWYVDETDPLGLTPAYFSGSYSPSDTVFNYRGPNRLVPGDYLLISTGEIVYVQNVAVGAGISLTVKRGQFGTTATAFGYQSFVESSLDPNDPCVVVGTTGLGWTPGDVTSGALRIAAYNAATGHMRFMTPIDPALWVASTLSIVHRVWQLSRSTVTETFAPGFFSSHGVAGQEVRRPLPHAMIAAVTGYLTSTRQIPSSTVIVIPPLKPRTHGGAILKMPFEAAAAGSFLDAFLPVTVPALSTFEQAEVRVLSGSNTAPIRAPGRTVSPLPDQYSAGSITLSGAVVPGGGAVAVTVGTVSVPAWFVPTDGSITTLSQCAIAIRDWLNGGGQFTGYYSADAAGNVITIQDMAGVGGSISVVTDGTITAACTGLSPALGIAIGRQYAASFYDATDSFETNLSPVSRSSGPTFSAASIDVRNMPASSDSRVTHVRLYATPDGARGPYHRVAEITNGSFNSYADSTTESALAALPVYGGPVQPSSGGITVTLSIDGTVWLQLYVPSGATVSDAVSGLATGPIPQGSHISADIVNNAAAVDLEVVLA